MFIDVVYLERICRTRNMARFYRLSAVETLFGDWTVVREWGRIGRGGQSREQRCETLDEARAACQQQEQHRMRRGYRIR